MEVSRLGYNVSISYTEFIFLPFPGVTLYRQILIVPFFITYVVILVLNLLIPYIIWVERSLHAPMYVLIGFFLSMNIISVSAVIPKMLLSFLGQNQISLPSCLVQMFFAYSSILFKSVMLVLMALDRFVAVCHPLRYYIIINRKSLLQLWTVGLARNFLLVFLFVFLASRVQYCKSNRILNFVCEYVVLLNLACGDVSRAHLFGLMVRTGVTASDVSILLFCYWKVVRAALKIAVGSKRHKALHTCAMHLLVTLTVYFCGLLSSILYKVEEFISPDSQNLSSVIYFLFPATMNPVVYGLGMNEIKECLVKTWKKKLVSNIRGQQMLVSRVVQ